MNFWVADSERDKWSKEIGEISRKRVSDLLSVTECSNRRRNARIGDKMLSNQGRNAPKSATMAYRRWNALKSMTVCLSVTECSQINDDLLISDEMLSNRRPLGYFWVSAMVSYQRRWGFSHAYRRQFGSETVGFLTHLSATVACQQWLASAMVGFLTHLLATVGVSLTVASDG